MPAERRTLRSNKSETSSSANGEKPRSDSQSSPNKKDRPAPNRSASSRSKSISNKKGATTLAKDMSGDKPQMNGNGSDPLENGVNGTDDLEMDQDSSKSTGKTKPGKDKDGDEEMTVVVPPAKGSKLSGEPAKDDEGDVAMNGATEDDVKEPAEPVVDPKSKAITGKPDKQISHSSHVYFWSWIWLICAMQTSRAISSFLSVPSPNSTPDLHYESSGLSLPFENS